MTNIQIKTTCLVVILAVLLLVTADKVNYINSVSQTNQNILKANLSLEQELEKKNIDQRQTLKENIEKMRNANLLIDQPSSKKSLN
jgi:Tfp pilus assembly protein PilE